MTARTVSLAALALVTLATTAEAQRRSSPSVARITPYVGYMQFGNYVDGPFGTSVRNAGAPLYGEDNEYVLGELLGSARPPSGTSRATT